MKWNDIYTQTDINELMGIFGFFHDACVKEMYFYSDTHVNTELAMSFGWEPYALIIFQRQWRNPSVIEIKFSEVQGIHIAPPDKNHVTNIMRATLKKKNNVFYWAEVEHWDIEDEGQNNYTWISAKKMSWRIKDDTLLGKSTVYSEVL